jgi:sigma-B regulation protein RsbU (phosphoserine phosphatase)
MPLFRFKHIANRLLFWILGVCLLIFVGFAVLLHQQATALIRLQAQAQAQLAVDIVVQKIEALLANTSHSVRTARSSLLNTNTSAIQLDSLLQDLLRDNPRIFGMALALEPGVFPGKAKYAPYVYRKGRELGLLDLSNAYDYRRQPWYREVMVQGRSLWSAPYFDHGAGDIPMVTYSSPIIAASDSDATRLLGVITADVSLQTLNDLIAANPLGDGQGYAYIVSAEAQIITHPDPQLRLAVADQLPGWAQSSEGWLALIEAVKRHERGHVILPCIELPQEQCWLSYGPLENSDWSIVARIPMQELESSVLSLRHRIIAGFAVACGLLTALILTLSRMLTQPINSLAKHTEHIARGNLNKPLPAFELNDEVGILADNIGNMQAELQHHITQLTAATCRRERMQTELAIAARIQAQMLPDGGQSQFQCGAFELVAATRPARQVGGDLYLYQRLAKQRLFFLIGDVSDKGVPAALFMAQCAAQVRELLGYYHNPAELLGKLNLQLAFNNENCMFVTAIAGVIDTHSGECSLASAGHPSPLLLNENCQSITLKTGAALGLQEDATYIEHSLILRPGDTLFLYTDGVDEAIDNKQTQFGLEGLQLAIKALQRDCSGTLVQGLMQHVIDYQHGQAFDDITLMTINNKTLR